MFKHLNMEHSRGIKGPALGFKNQTTFYRNQDGYNNVDSPMKAAFRMEASPHKNLSPMKLNSQQKVNRIRSPKILSKKDDNVFSGTKNLSPFRRVQYRQQIDQSQYSGQKNMSFTNLIRKNSNTACSPHVSPLIQKTIEHSTASNYLQSDRNYREDTNLFRKLADMLESNKSNDNRSFVNSVYEENSRVLMPQSCRNVSNQGSNKKVLFKNILTVESIQSPEQRDYEEEPKCYGQMSRVETKCYSQYERSTSQYPTMEKRQSNAYRNQNNDLKMQKKQSHNISNIKENQGLTFKKLTSPNRKQNEQDEKQKIIDFHLTNSFGNIFIKNQLPNQSLQKKKIINPFHEIQKQSQPHTTQINVSASNHQRSSNQQQEFVQEITQSVKKSQDSVFASLQMLLEKVDTIQDQILTHKQNQSINISLVSENQMSDLDMEPFIEKRN